MDESCILVILGSVRNLDVSVLFGMTFIDNFIKGIFHTERMMVPLSSPPLPILVVHEKEPE